MTLQERLDQANAQSVTVYLRRQQLQAQMQQLQAAAQQTDLELVKLDGTIETLTELLAEQAHG